MQRVFGFVLGVLGVVVLLGVGGEAEEPCSISFSPFATFVDDEAFGNLYAEQPRSQRGVLCVSLSVCVE